MAQKAKELLAKIKKLPGTPGVYKFLNSKGRIIYVGKARNLKKRVTSYFQSARARNNRLELMVSEVKDVEIIRASSEAEALIYEAGLIKDHSPKFNVELKDDKSYPFLKLTMDEKYPRLFLTRRRINNGAIYYGPYVNVKLLKEALPFMKRIFPLRSCSRMPKEVCLEYHIAQCLGPCEGRVPESEYKKTVEHLKKFLEGKKEELLEALRSQMKRYSEQKEYEKALSVRKRLEALTLVRAFHDRVRRPIYGELDELRGVLRMKDLPLVIECFDVSNILGREAVGSMVRFVSGMPKKSEYRRFRIKTISAIDDYAMIREIVTRRYSRLLKEGKKMPDLVLIDGGKAHLAVSERALVELGLSNIPVASIAKEYNHLYVRGRVQPLRLSPGSRVLLLIQRIRDEAHRFAISYHRFLRSKASFGG